MTLESIRQSPAYKVLTPDRALELVTTLGQHSVLYLNPLLDGIAHIAPARLGHFSIDMLRCRIGSEAVH